MLFSFVIPCFVIFSIASPGGLPPAEQTVIGAGQGADFGRKTACGSLPEKAERESDGYASAQNPAGCRTAPKRDVKLRAGFGIAPDR